jgi:membrane-bound lytic murein transglycosylase D
VTVTALRAANKLHSTIIHPGQDLLIAASPKALQASAQLASIDERPPVAPKSGRHVVRRGDTLWSIARRHGVSMDRLASANGLSRSGTLSIGTVLSIPGTATLAAAGSAVETRSTTYVVRSGDTLSRIAHRFRVRLADLLGWNELSTRSVITPGQRLVMYLDERRRAGI